MSNIDVIHKGLVNYSIRMENKILSLLLDVADDLVYWIEGSRSIPVATGNLQDSTGVGVYYNGTLRKFKPTQIASVPRGSLWGTMELSKALELASTDFNSGLWIVIFSTMPYAMKIDDRTNFFEGGLRSDLLSGLKQRLSNGVI